jgi:hypothetical protein
MAKENAIRAFVAKQKKPANHLTGFQFFAVSSLSNLTLQTASVEASGQMSNQIALFIGDLELW